MIPCPPSALSGEREAFSDREACEHLAQLCKALAHPAHIRIVQFLASVETCFCGDIVKQLPLAQSTVSQHLKILKEAGIVQGRLTVHIPVIVLLVTNSRSFKHSSLSCSDTFCFFYRSSSIMDKEI